jgi:hypothetical protein
MAKRTFSRQGFLNPATSPDSGHYKFSLIKKGLAAPGRVTVFYRIADCSQNIELDFGTYGIGDKSKVAQSKIKECLSDITARRKKMQKFVGVVTTFAEKYDAAMAEAYEELKQYEDDLFGEPE